MRAFQVFCVYTKLETLSAPACAVIYIARAGSSIESPQPSHYHRRLVFTDFSSHTLRNIEVCQQSEQRRIYASATNNLTVK